MRSFGGRATQFQRINRVRPPRAPAAVFPAVPAVVYTESFNKADGSLGPDLTWVVGAAANAAVESNRAVNDGSDPAVFATARAEHDTSSPNMYVQADIAVADDFNDIVILVGRCGDTASLDSDVGVYMQIDGAANPTLTNVAIADLDDDDPFDNYQAAGIDMVATWRLELDGNEGRAYRNGVLLLTSDITAITATGTRAGFILSDVTASPRCAIDNFEYGDL